MNSSVQIIASLALLALAVSACGPVTSSQRKTSTTTIKRDGVLDPNKRIEDQMECGYEFEEVAAEERAGLLQPLDGKWIDNTGAGWTVEKDEDKKEILTRQGFQFDAVDEKHGPIKYIFRRHDNTPQPVLEKTTEVETRAELRIGKPLEVDPFKGYRPIEIHPDGPKKLASCTTYLYKIEQDPQGGVRLRLSLGATYSSTAGRGTQEDLIKKMQEYSANPGRYEKR